MKFQGDQHRVFECWNSFFSKILENKPNDYGSRWCSETNTYPQFITLKLAPCLLNTITFGKYEKTNLCNTRKFEIHGGWEPDGMVKLYEGRLRNDAIPETFQLRTMVGQRPFPVRFLKIAPLQTWGSSFNFCIWYVELRGIEEESALRPFINTLDTVSSTRRFDSARAQKREHRLM